MSKNNKVVDAYFCRAAYKWHCKNHPFIHVALSLNYCFAVLYSVPQNLARKVQESLSKVNQVALETFSNMKTVRSFANEEGQCLRHEARLHDTYQLHKMESLAYAFNGLANSVSTL